MKKDDKNNTTPANHSLAHTKWNCKYHIVFAPKFRRMVFFKENNNPQGTVQLERGNDHPGRNLSGPCPHAGGDTAENECVRVCRIPEREEQPDHP